MKSSFGYIIIFYFFNDESALSYLYDINYFITIYSTRYQELIEQIAEVEVCVARAQSVRHKILGDAAAAHSSAQHLEDLVLRLLDSPEVSLEGGPRGPAALAIRKLFQQARKVSYFVSLSFYCFPTYHDS